MYVEYGPATVTLSVLLILTGISLWTREINGVLLFGGLSFVMMFGIVMALVREEKIRGLEETVNE